MFFPIFLSFIAVTLSTSKNQFIWTRNRVFDDVIITTDVIDVLADFAGETSCGMTCASKFGCQSFSYHGNRTCRLHSVNFENSASSLPSPGSRLFTKYSYCPTEDGFVLLQNVKLCLKFFYEPKTFYAAREICQESGSRVIVVDNVDKNTAVHNYITANIGAEIFYLGLTDEVNEGVFVWENGEDAAVTNWDSGQPSNEMGNENCVELRTNGRWNDIACTSHRKYICEKVF